MYYMLSARKLNIDWSEVPIAGYGWIPINYRWIPITDSRFALSLSRLLAISEVLMRIVSGWFSYYLVLVRTQSWPTKANSGKIGLWGFGVSQIANWTSLLHSSCQDNQNPYIESFWSLDLGCSTPRTLTWSSSIKIWSFWSTPLGAAQNTWSWPTTSPFFWRRVCGVVPVWLVKLGASGSKHVLRASSNSFQNIAPKK